MTKKTKAVKGYYNYPTVEAYQEHLQKGGAIHDNVVIEGILFTQDEYDREGRYLTYGNKRTGKGIEVETADRYMSTHDAVVTLSDSGCFRNDIIYLD